jgi:hypothetical protein
MQIPANLRILGRYSDEALDQPIGHVHRFQQVTSLTLVSRHASHCVALDLEILRIRLRLSERVASSRAAAAIAPYSETCCVPIPNWPRQLPKRVQDNLRRCNIDLSARSQACMVWNSQLIQ